MFYFPYLAFRFDLENGSTCSGSFKEGSALSICMVGEFYHAFVLVLCSLLQEVYQWLKTLRARLGESIISPTVWKTIEDTKHIIDNKCIYISVLGQHNCGKSTFINALLGDE